MTESTLCRYSTSNSFVGKPSFFLLSSMGCNNTKKKDPNAYIKRFHERSLNYYDPLVDEVLVDVCLHGMLEEYTIFLNNLSFPCLSRLMEAACRINE